MTELATLARDYHPRSEVIVVSDGSRDGTAEKINLLNIDNVRIIELAENAGKANAINKGAAIAKHDVLVFADVRQTWRHDTIATLLNPLGDHSVGAVSGELVLQDGNALADVAAYWRFEKWLRDHESTWHSSIGVTGAIAAVRRSLYRPLAKGIVLDDVCWPMGVVMQGFRVVYVAGAVAYDCLPDRLSDEYKRKVRTLAGNYQLVALHPELLLPWRNPVCLQFVSHKVMRLTTPWFTMAALMTGMVLVRDPLYACLVGLVTIAVVVGMLVAFTGKLSRVRLFGLLGTVFMLNYAAWMAFWVWACGRVSRSWKKVEYARE